MPAGAGSRYIPFFTSSWTPSSSIIRGARNSRSFTYFSRPWRGGKQLVRKLEEGGRAACGCSQWCCLGAPR